MLWIPWENPNTLRVCECFHLRARNCEHLKKKGILHCASFPNKCTAWFYGVKTFRKFLGRFLFFPNFWLVFLLVVLCLHFQKLDVEVLLSARTSVWSVPVVLTETENIWRLSLNDNRWLWQSGAWREKIRTPQPGNEPGTSWLSFRCSTNWATGEFMSSPSQA